MALRLSQDLRLRDPAFAIAEKFNTYRFADCKEKVIDLCRPFSVPSR